MSTEPKPIDLESLIQSMENDDPFVQTPEPTPEPPKEPEVPPVPEPPVKDPEPTPEPPTPEPEPTPPGDPVPEPPAPEPEPPVDPEITPPNPEEPLDDKLLQAYYEQMSEFGYFNLPEEFKFDGTEEGFKEAVEQTQLNLKRSANQELFDALPPDYQAALQYAIKGGGSLEDFVGQVNNEIDYETADISKPEVSKKILTEYYKASTKYNDEKIDKFITRLEKLDALEEEAEEAAEYLKSYHKNRRDELLKEQNLKAEQARIDEENRRKAQMEAVDNFEMIKGKRKNDIKSYMANVIRKNNQEATGFYHTLKEILNDPVREVELANFVYGFDKEKGFDYSKFTAQGKNQAVNSFQRALQDKIGAAQTRTNNAYTQKSQMTSDQWQMLLQQYD